MTAGRKRPERSFGVAKIALSTGLILGLFLMAGQGTAADSMGLRPAETPAAWTVDSKQSERNAESQAPSDLAREGMAKLLQALDTLIQSIPQFEMPAITENGDIILRRKRPHGCPHPDPAAPTFSSRGNPDVALAVLTSAKVLAERSDKPLCTPIIALGSENPSRPN